MQDDNVLSDDLVPIKILAQEFGMDRSHMRRFVLKHKFETVTARSVASGNQKTLCVTKSTAEKIRDFRLSQGYSLSKKENTTNQIEDSGQGWFYFIALIPEFNPNRIKLGFTNSLTDRLASHRTVAPTLQLIKSWKAKRPWEYAAIDCALQSPNTQVGQEVYDFEDWKKALNRLETFFELMGQQN